MAGLLGRVIEAVRGRDVERRRSSVDSVGWGVGVHAGGGMVDARRAENISTVAACVGAISSALASLPAIVYRAEAGGRAEAPTHPVARLIRCPNEYQTWNDWLEFSMSQVLLYGNAVSIIDYDGAGRPVRLVPVPWNAGVLLSMLPGGRLAYDINPTWAGAPIAPGRYFADQVFHLKDRSSDGLVGVARLARSPELIEGAMALSSFATSVWQNAAQPSGFIRHPGRLNSDGRLFLKNSLTEAIAGPQNARKLAVLDEGMEWQESGANSPETAQLIESRRFLVAEICRLFQVPPPIVQSYENNAFTSAQQADQWFARHSLAPWAKKLESEFARSLFGPGSDFHLEIDFSALVRGSYVERWQTEISAVAAGILTVDEVRAQEGFPPMPVAPIAAAPPALDPP